MKAIKWGIIGPGHIAHKFTSDLIQVKGAALHAVASRDIDKAKKFAKKYQFRNYYEGYDELIKKSGVDIVYVATPHSFHYEISKKCIEHNIAVLCEKPITINSGQMQELIKQSYARKVFLMEAFWTRFIPSFKKVIQLVQENAIGKIHLIKANFGYSFPFTPEHRLYNPLLGGGSLLDIGIYPVFLAATILGYPDEIKATASMAATGVDQDCEIIFKYKNGQTAMLDSSLVVNTSNEAEIYGERGHIKMHKRWHHSNKITITNGKGTKVVRFRINGHGYGYEAHHAMNCFRKGWVESNLWPLKSSLQLQNLLDAIRKQIHLVYPSE